MHEVGGDAIEKIMEEGGAVEIGERSLPVFVAPGGVGHPLEALVIAAELFDRDAGDPAHDYLRAGLDDGPVSPERVELSRRAALNLSLSNAIFEPLPIPGEQT